MRKKAPPYFEKCESILVLSVDERPIKKPYGKTLFSSTESNHGYPFYFFVNKNTKIIYYRGKVFGQFAVRSLFIGGE